MIFAVLIKNVQLNSRQKRERFDIIEACRNNFPDSPQKCGTYKKLLPCRPRRRPRRRRRRRGMGAILDSCRPHADQIDRFISSKPVYLRLHRKAKKYEKTLESLGFQRFSIWLREEDSNFRPSGYEPDELPLLHPAICGCALALT